MNFLKAVLGLILVNPVSPKLYIDEPKLLTPNPVIEIVPRLEPLLPSLDASNTEASTTPEIATTTQIANIVAESTSTPIKKDLSACSCVKVARQAGLNIPLGTDANEIKPNSHPTIGGAILFYYPDKKIHHIAVIKKLLSNGWLVYEGNFKKCTKSTRIVDFNDPFIKGFTDKNVELYENSK